MWPLRITVFLSPLVWFFVTVPAAGPHTMTWYAGAFVAFRLFYWGSWLSWLIPWIVLAALTDYYAQRTGRDEIVTLGAMVAMPLVTPIVLAVLPITRYSADVPWWRRSATRWGFGGGARGQFEERFPLLAKSLEGQPEQTQIGLREYFRNVQVNFEFLLGAHPKKVNQLLSEGQARGFVIWTGASREAPIVYGAGMARPDSVDEIAQWLAAAGAPGQKLSIAYRDAAGMPQFLDHYLDRAAGTGV